jgi:hypothetical protein
VPPPLPTYNSSNAASQQPTATQPPRGQRDHDRFKLVGALVDLEIVMLPRPTWVTCRPRYRGTRSDRERGRSPPTVNRCGRSAGWAHARRRHARMFVIEIVIPLRPTWVTRHHGYRGVWSDRNAAARLPP